MKKLQALAVLPLFALASCAQKDVTVEEKVEPKTENTTTDTQATSVVSTGEALNENVSTGVTQVANGVEVKEFDEPYALPNGMKVSIKGSVEIQDGKVTNVTFKDAQGVQLKFAEALPAQIIGKEVKGLKLDAVSGASLTSEAFNNFVNKINK